MNLSREHQWWAASRLTSLELWLSTCHREPDPCLPGAPAYHLPIVTPKRFFSEVCPCTIVSFGRSHATICSALVYLVRVRFRAALRLIHGYLKSGSVPSLYHDRLTLGHSMLGPSSTVPWQQNSCACQPRIERSYSHGVWKDGSMGDRCKLSILSRC